MNELLIKAEKWLIELGIRTVSGKCLHVNRDDITILGDANELIKNLRSALGTNKFYWASFDDNNYYLDVF
jgi:hypothetical protein